MQFAGTVFHPDLCGEFALGAVIILSGNSSVPSVEAIGSAEDQVGRAGENFHAEIISADTGPGYNILVIHTVAVGRKSCRDADHINGIAGSRIGFDIPDQFEFLLRDDEVILLPAGRQEQQ